MRKCGGDRRAIGYRLSVEESSDPSSAPSPVTRHPSPNILGLTTALLDQSLIRQVEDGGQPRFAMLEMIREYAVDRLAERGELETVRARHSAYMLALAEEAEPHLRGPQQNAWLDRLELEHSNLRDALRWFHEQGNLGRGLQLAGALGRFYEVRGHVAEGRRVLDDLLAQADHATLPSAILARALSQAGTLAWAQSDFAAALERHQSALEGYREADDAWGIAFSITCIGTQKFGHGDLDAAQQQHFGEGHERFQALGDAWGAALAQTNLGVIAQLRGERGEAERAFARARVLYRAAGSVDELALISVFLGRVISERGDQTTARQLLDEGIAQIEASGSRFQLAYARYQLAFVIQARGDHREAIASFVESATLCRDQGDLLGYAQSAEGMATSLVALGFHQRAARLLAAADQIRQALAAPLPPAETLAVERASAATRAALGAKDFAAASSAGKRLTPAQALAEMLAPLPAREAAAAAPPRSGAPVITGERLPGFDLTRREREVLGLLTKRYTDAEVAEQLFISPKTASNHVANILSKLGASNRREAGAIANRLGLA